MDKPKKKEEERILTGETIVMWRNLMGYNQRDAADQLDCSRDALSRYENDKTGESIPGHIGLACDALAMGIKPYANKRKK